MSDWMMSMGLMVRVRVPGPTLLVEVEGGRQGSERGRGTSGITSCCVEEQGHSIAVR